MIKLALLEHKKHAKSAISSGLAIRFKGISFLIFWSSSGVFVDSVSFVIVNPGLIALVKRLSLANSKAKVLVKITKNLRNLSITIADDGAGFSRDILDKLGEPYINKNNKGMGLGIFIAKNLIENVKGKIIFYNSDSGKAVVEMQFQETILIK